MSDHDTIDRSEPVKPTAGGAESKAAMKRGGRRGKGPLRRTLGFPSTQPNLAPTAQRLLEAARHILERDGYNAISVDAIGREAGENKALIRYYFGDKAGLMVALIDWLIHDTMWEVRRHLAALAAEEDRLGVIIDDAATSMLADPRSYRLFFDLLPHLLENPMMAAQLADLYRAYREMNTWGLWGDPREDVPQPVRNLAALTVALIDGLAVQLVTERDSVDVTGALEMWRTFVEGVLVTVPAPGDNPPAPLAPSATT